AAGSVAAVLAGPEAGAEPWPESRSARWVCTRAASQISPETDTRSWTSGLGPAQGSPSGLCSTADPVTGAAGVALESKRNASRTSTVGRYDRRVRRFSSPPPANARLPLLQPPRFSQPGSQLWLNPKEPTGADRPPPGPRDPFPRSEDPAETGVGRTLERFSAGLRTDHPSSGPLVRT